MRRPAEPLSASSSPPSSDRPALQSTLGRVTIQIDKVVSEGVYSGLFSLNHDGNRDGSSRTLEIEILWSNRTSGDGM